jgi:hypothetical protein
VGYPIRQTNFTAGELDPLVQGRSDLPIFTKGLKTCRNIVPLKGGAAMTRPGSTFVAHVKQVGAYAAGATPPRPVRLQAFVFADDSTAVLELGEQYIRFYSLGRAAQAVPGTPYEVTTYTDQAGLEQPLPFTADKVWDLRFAQIGNLVTIVGPGMPAIELRRNAATDWSAIETTFAPPEATLLPDVGGSYFTNPFNPGSVQQNITTSPFAIIESSIAAENLASGRPAREWVHAFTAIMQHRQTGVIFESLATVVKYSTPNGVDSWPASAPTLTTLTTQKFAIYKETPLKLKRMANAAGADPLYRTLAFRMYRGRGDLLGWIGDTRGREFVDVGEEPDYAVQPPLGFQPFRRLLGGIVFYERPVSVAFFQERRVFGGASFITARTQLSPGVWLGGDDIGRVGHLFFSATGDYYNFDERLALHVAGEALSFELASEYREHVRHLIPLERLVILTNQSAWTMSGQQGSPLDFDSVNARRTDKVGAAGVPPLVVGGCVLFVRTKGTGARALVPTGSDEQPYAGVDLNDNARHLVTGTDLQLVDWAYQEDPFGLVWAVRQDGALLSLTFQKEPNVVAWARHDSEDGDAIYESVCTVPEGEEDAVYVVVSRPSLVGLGAPPTTVRVIERFASRVRRVKETDPNPANVATPGVDDTSTLYPTDVCLDSAIVYRGAPTRTITGLGLHRNKTVWVNARGSPPMTGIVDAAGQLELDDQQMPALPATNAVDENGNGIWVAHVGLLFECDLESLAVAGDVLKVKTVSEVGFELDESRGVKAGQSFAKLTTWKQRKVSDAFGAISAATELLVTPVTNAWDRTARVCLRQSLPLPVTVVGITRTVE